MNPNLLSPEAAASRKPQMNERAFTGDLKTALHVSLWVYKAAGDPHERASAYG